MTLTVRLTEDEEKKLQQILQMLHVDDRSSLIRDLINEKWQSLQSKKTFVERRGGHPEHLLPGQPNASERGTRKNVVTERYSVESANKEGAK